MFYSSAPRPAPTLGEELGLAFTTQQEYMLAARAGNLGVVRLLAGCGRVELITLHMEEVGENWEAILEVLQVSMKERAVQKAKMQKEENESSSDERKTDVEISGQNKLLRPFNFSKAFGLKPTSRPRKRSPH